MKSMTTKLMLVVAIGSAVSGSARAGELDPPGTPGPTMVTLQQIYDLLQDTSTVTVGVTGQTGCWNSVGSGINCTGTGQDGEHQYGASASPRFTDRGDGTIKDNLTRLIWMKNANCFGARTWTSALSDANLFAAGACGVTDGSVAGNWRLPNIKELQSLIDFGNANPALPTGHPFTGVQSTRYWSSTTLVENPDFAWYMPISSGGGTINVGKTGTGFVWPVRSGN